MTYTYTCTYIHLLQTYACTNQYIHTNEHMHIHIHTHIHLHICMHIHSQRHRIHKHTHIHIPTNMHIHLHMHIHVHVHFHTHAYAYTYTHTHTPWKTSTCPEMVVVKPPFRAECMKVVACITCFQAARLPHLHFMRGRRFLLRLV